MPNPSMPHPSAQRRWLGLAITAGGVIWMIAGAVVSTRPAGTPPYSYRATTDIVPWLGLGLLLIGCGIGRWLMQYRPLFGRVGRLSILFTIGGAVSYAIGSSVRAGFLSGGWEPLAPFGFLASVGGLFLAGVASLRAQAVPRVVSALLIAASICLLFVNDQLTPWMAIPFGLLAVALGCFLLVGPKEDS